MTATVNIKENTTMNTYKVTDTERLAHTVEAAYFQEEGRFVVFKDQKHATCFMIRAEVVVSVKRVSVDV